ncbi:MAG: DUF1838 family protein [Gammaproteobacteria bacterium]|nr:DUF1838 family protein [Gammaproteobacteria bacterium]
MNSMFLNDLLIGRRQALVLLAAGAATLGSSAVPAAVAVQMPPKGKLDFRDPLDNLYTFGKVWAGYDTPVIGGFSGIQYARIPGRRAVPVFGFAGTGVLFAEFDRAAGKLRLKSRETAFFTDLRTGDILETWDNPFTNETVPVYHFYNYMNSGEVGTEMPTFLMPGQSDSPTTMNDGTVFADPDGRLPFTLPIEQFGPDDLMIQWDYAHRYNNPVSAAWGKYSTGPIITPSEHFTFHTSRKQVEDPDVQSARFIAGFSRMSDPWPWMRMGGHEYAGLTLFGRMHSRKGLPGTGDVSPKVLAYLEKHAPEYLTLPDGWEELSPRLDTWTAFSRDVPPEDPAAAWPGKDDPKVTRPPTGLGARFHS